MPVVAIEARCPLIVDDLVLTDEVMTIRVSACDLIACHFIQDLRVASRVIRINKIMSRDTIDGLADAVAVTVIDKGHTSAIDCREMVLK